MTPHHFFTVGLIGLSVALAGCKGNDPSTPKSPQALTPVPVVPDAKNTGTLPTDDASLLARRTSQYVNETAPLLDQHPSTAPSIVRFVDPPKTQAPVASAIKPGDQAKIVAGAARQAAYTQPQDDVPQILPESADFQPAAPASKTPVVTIATDEYERKLQKQVIDYPKDIAGQLDYELLRFVRGETTPDLASISGMTAEDREVTAALMDGLSNFRDTVRADNNLLLSRKIQPLIEMADRLRSQAELTIPTVALCVKVDSFGVYKPVAASRFAAGHENPVIVYTEIGNFSSSVDDEKLWQTRLKQEMTLYTETGMSVWPEKSNAQSFTDKARNRRHDFFLARIAKLPANLTIGRYLLKVSVTDEQNNRVAEISTPLEIVAE